MRAQSSPAQTTSPLFRCSALPLLRPSAPPLRGCPAIRTFRSVLQSLFLLCSSRQFSFIALSSARIPPPFDPQTVFKAPAPIPSTPSPCPSFLASRPRRRDNIISRTHRPPNRIYQHLVSSLSSFVQVGECERCHRHHGDQRWSRRSTQAGDTIHDGQVSFFSYSAASIATLPTPGGSKIDEGVVDYLASFGVPLLSLSFRQLYLAGQKPIWFIPRDNGR